jgi:hypothetical protein
MIKVAASSAATWVQSSAAWTVDDKMQVNKRERSLALHPSIAEPTTVRAGGRKVPVFSGIDPLHAPAPGVLRSRGRTVSRHGVSLVQSIKKNALPAEARSSGRDG